MTRRKQKLGRTGLREKPFRDERINFLINPELKQWLLGYVKRKHVTITTLVIAYFVKLKETEEGIDVEQI